ncbi:MAG: homoserine dehydrogenase [Spirochaetaceae bacterium]|nr:MAG: homoserine dehydrogenase [Spirochaetaceae bacterium]
MKQQSNTGIAVIGCGTVGGAVCEILLRDRKLLEAKTGSRLHLKYIVDRVFTAAQNLQLDDTLFETSLDRALEDDEVTVFVELVGGITTAREITEQALRAGKHVVTANKALLAHHGAELLAVARQNGVCLAFEAAVGGGIPVLRALYDGLAANSIDAIYGIVNGTCNYILTEMIDKEESYEEALWAAQSKGLAETDPTLDVSGADSAHKVAIMGAMAFGIQVDFDQIPVEGIDSLQREDVMYADTLGYVVKLLAIATRVGEGISLRVRPVFISRDHALAWVSGPFNAVSIYGHTTGHTMYYGRGAGGTPTASAVVSDILAVASGTYQVFFDRFAFWPDRNPPTELVPVAETYSRFYIRTMVDDTPGALASIASILGTHGISIASILQDELPENNGAEEQPHFVPVVITVHPAREANVLSAIAEIDDLDATGEKSSVISIVDDHPEGVF